MARWLVPRRRVPAIPLAADSGLLEAARRTTIVRLGLAATLVALLLAAILLAHRISPRPSEFVPNGRGTVIVIDLSQSIPHGAFPTIARVLRRVVEENLPVGLVVFSDTAYELLPPGTPGRELRPFLRYFTPLPGTGSGSVWNAAFAPNPWQQVFRGGTHISAALALARSMLIRDRVDHGSILLISDLEAPAQDVPPLTSVIDRLRQDDIPLRIVSLFPSHEARAFFTRLTGRGAFTNERDAIVTNFDQPTPRGGPPVPVALVAVGLVLLLLLAWNEGWLARLPVPARARSSEVAP